MRPRRRRVPRVGLARRPGWFEIHTMGFFGCMTKPSEVRHATEKRWLGVIVAVVLPVFVRPRAGRWAQRRSLGQVLFALAGTLIAALLALAASEAILRRTKPKPGSPTYNYEPLSSPMRGWSGAPWCRTPPEFRVGDKDLRFYVDANSWRVRSADEVVDFDKPTILFPPGSRSPRGSASTNYEETYPFMVGQDLGVQVVNLAVQAYGVDQAYLRMERDALPRFQHVLAAVTLVVLPSIMRTVAVGRRRLGLADDGSFVTVPRHDDDLRLSFVRGGPG